MKKLIIFIIFVILLGIGINTGKNYYFKTILTKELNKKYGEEINIDSVKVGIIDKNISIKNFNVKNKINIKNINLKVSILEILKNKEINIDEVKISGVNLKIDTQKEGISSKNYGQNFINEMNEKIDLKDNVLNAIGNIFSKDEIFDVLSNNLINFLINNVDYIDVIIQNKINDSLKDKKLKLSQEYLKFTNFLQDGFYTQIFGKYVFINNISIDGEIEDAIFSGNIKNITNNYEKAKNISIDFLIKSRAANGSKISIVGEFDPKKILGNIYLKSPALYLDKWEEFSEYFQKGMVSCDQVIKLNKKSLDISGRIQINDILLNKEIFIKRKDIDDLDKLIINKILSVAEKNITTIIINNEYSTTANVIQIKTSIPQDIKNILIRDKGNIKNDISKDVDEYYSNYIKTKKRNINQFFKNIFK